MSTPPDYLFLEDAQDALGRLQWWLEHPPTRHLKLPDIESLSGPHDDPAACDSAFPTSPHLPHTPHQHDGWSIRITESHTVVATRLEDASDELVPYQAVFEPTVERRSGRYRKPIYHYRCDLDHLQQISYQTPSGGVETLHVRRPSAGLAMTWTWTGPTDRRHTRAVVSEQVGESWEVCFLHDKRMRAHRRDGPYRLTYHETDDQWTVPTDTLGAQQVGVHSSPWDFADDVMDSTEMALTERELDTLVRFAIINPSIPCMLH